MKKKLLEIFILPNLFFFFLLHDWTTVMNVIMPTAMSTMHQEKELQESSARTAKRGLCVLETLIDQHALIEDNAKAILAVATDQSKDEKKSNLLIKVWLSYFFW